MRAGRLLAAGLPGVRPATSHVQRGTLYEATVSRTLARFNFSMDRVGKAGDGGIDLVGSWQPAAAPRPLPGDAVVLQAVRAGTPDDPTERIGAVAQCKCSSKPATQTSLRDFSFVLSSRPGVLGVFACSAGFTAGKALVAIPCPILLLHITEDGALQAARLVGSPRQGDALARWHIRVGAALQGAGRPT